MPSLGGAGVVPSVHAGVLVASGVVAALMIAVTLRHRAERIAYPLGGLFAVAGLWALADAGQLLATDPSTMTVLVRARASVAACVGPLLLWLVLEYVDRGDLLSRRRLAVLHSVPVLTVAVVVTPGVSQLYVSVVDVVHLGDPVTGATYTSALTRHGPWYVVGVTYNYALILTGLGILLWSFFTAKVGALHRGQTATLLLAMSLPLAANVPYQLGMVAVELTPATFVFGLALMAVAIFRFELFTLVPIARNTAVEEMEEGFLVLDRADCVVDANPAGAAMLGTDPATVEGEHVEDVLPSVDELARDAGAGSAEVADGDETAPEVADADVPASEVTDADVPAPEVADADVPASEVTDADVPASEVTDADVPASEVTDGDVPASEVTDADVPASEVTDGDVPASEVTDAGAIGADVTDVDATGRPDDDVAVPVGGDRYCAVTVSDIGDSNGRSVGRVVLLKDVTDRVHRERELRERTEELSDRTVALEHQNERLEEFASVLSHDLRNPLGVASTYLERARESGDPDDLDAVEAGLAEIETLVEDLLAMARQGQVVRERDPVHLDDLVRRAWGQVDGGDVRLRVRTDAVVSGDRTRLLQVFENLFANAVRHADSTGETSAGTSTGATATDGSGEREPSTGDAADGRSGGESLAITVGDLDDGFYVEDDGRGIPPEERERAFERGYTTHSAGTGLGLAIVRMAVEAHGWSVDVVEGSDGGARFEVRGVETSDAGPRARSA